MNDLHDKKKCLRRDSFGICISYDADYKPYKGRHDKNAGKKPNVIPSNKPGNVPVKPDKPISGRTGGGGNVPVKPDNPMSGRTGGGGKFTPGAAITGKTIFPSRPETTGSISIKGRTLIPSRGTFKPSSMITARTLPTDNPIYTPVITPPTPPEPTPPSPTPDNEKKKRRNDTQRGSGSTFKQRAKPGAVVDDEDKFSARVSEAAGIYKKEGLEKAQDYLDDNGLSNHVIDPDVSNDVGITTVNDINGETNVAFRGTNPKSIKDISTDLQLLANRDPESIDHYNKARELMDSTIDKYGKPEKLHGYSLGGATAITMGEENGIDTHTVNPAITKDILTRDKTVNHKITRTVNDFASIPLGYDTEGFDVKSIKTLKPSLNPFDAHDTKHILEDGERQDDVIKDAAKATAKAGQSAGEHVLIHETQKAIEQGKSFSDHVKDFSPEDIDEDGDLSQRTRGIEKMWREGGGELNDDEKDAIQERDDLAKTPTPPEPTEDSETLAAADVDKPEKEDEITQEPDEQPITPEKEMMTTKKERDNFRKKTPEQREKIVADKKEDLSTLTDALNKVTEPHNEVKKSVSNEFRDSVVDGLHPTNIAGGIVSGIIGNEVSKKIDPEGKLGVVGDEALSGAISGAIQEKAISRLAGQAVTKGALSGAAVSGATGLVAGAEAQKAVAKVLKKYGANKDTQDSVSQMVGGATGNVASEATNKVLAKGIDVTKDVIKGSGNASSAAEATGDIELATQGATDVAEASSVGADILSSITAAEELGGGELALETGGASLVAAAAIGTVVGAGGYLAGKLADTKAAKVVGKGVKTAAVDTAKGVKTAAVDTAKGVETAAKAVGSGVSTAAKATVSEAKSVGRSVSRATKKVGRFFRRL